MKILVTGSAGFVAGYVVEKLLQEGHSVIGIDNFSKYGKTSKNYDTNPNYIFVNGDAKNVNLLKQLIVDCDHFICLAGQIGGIVYFAKYAYDLFNENEKIMSSAMDAAIWAHKKAKLKKITLASSSVVYGSTTSFPSKEGDEYIMPPPESNYGFQKLAVHYWAKGGWDQYGLPYTLILPFNTIGLGETRANCDDLILSGNIQLCMGHVVPDLIHKALKKQTPFHILGSGDQLRHYTDGRDIADGFYLSLENQGATNQSFNISSPNAHTVYDLATMIWRKINGNAKLYFEHDYSFEKYDIKKRLPSVDKAKEILGFEAKISLSDSLDLIIPWVKQMIELGKI